MTSLFKRIVAGFTSTTLLAAGLVVGTVAVAPTASAATSTCVADMVETTFVADPYDPDLQNNTILDIYMYMDKARIGAGLKPFTRSPLLSGLAGSYASTGPRTGDLNHDTEENIVKWLPEGAIYPIAGENIWSGGNTANAYTIFSKWMASTDHKANILCKNLNYVGMGSNYPLGQDRRHIVQRFAHYPSHINPDDNNTWLPWHVSQSTTYSKQQTPPFKEDATLAPTNATAFQRDVLTEINRMRTAAGVAPVVLGQRTTAKTQEYITTLSDLDSMAQAVNNFPVSHNLTSIASTLTGSGSDAVEILLSRASERTGKNFVEMLVAKNPAYQSTILDPKWTHMGSHTLPESMYGYAAWYYGLRLTSYQPLPEPVAQNNTWSTSGVSIESGQTIPTQNATIQGAGPVYLQMLENGNWVNKKTIPVSGGNATVSYPALSAVGTYSFRLVSPGDSINFLDWTSGTKTVTIKAKAPQNQSSTWYASGTTMNAELDGGLLSGNSMAFIEAGGSVTLERLEGSSWKAVGTYPVPSNRYLEVPMPKHSAAGNYTYRLRHAGNSTFNAWVSGNATVAVSKKAQNNSFSTSSVTVGINERAGNRAASINATGIVTLQKQSGSSWINVQNFNVANGTATITFPQERGGRSVYRLYSAGDARYNAWASGSITVTAQKKSQRSSWSTSAATITFGQTPPARTASVEAKGLVQLQEYKSGAWRFSRSINASSGRASVAVPKPADTGTYQYRLYSPGNAVYNAWVSPTYKVVVKGKQQTGTIGNHDFNGDNRADMLWVNSSGKLYVLQGNGKGKFSKKYVGKGFKSYKKIVATGDLTGDGKADIIQVTSSGVAYLVKGTGKNKFQSKKIKIGSGWKTHKDVFSPGDLNGDRYGDIVFRKSNGLAYVMYGNGDGTFKAAKKLGVNWKSYKYVSQGGDYNRDGKADVILVDKKGKVTLARGTGKSSFKNMSIGSISKTDKFPTIAGNVNGGTYSDLMSMSSKGKLQMYAGKTSKKLNKAKSITTLGKTSRTIS